MVIMQSMYKSELVKRCQEMEKRGFDYICPIIKKVTYKKQFKDQRSGFAKREFDHIAMGIVYVVKMDKAEK